ncbi:MAG TPA: GDSL-type esterase/lipase family protein [Streptosporangiaceae bacterium]|nr:GDSL-type esterase/lipase family protein [Streptosporangiaceae bacterium]
MGTTEEGPRPARWATLTLRWLAGLMLLVVLACGAIAVALQVTPMQTITVAGQVIQVGATAPSLSLSGPGEIDLFGQSLPTNTQFTGPVRPRLQLSQISINSELTTFVEGTKAAGAERILGARLADGWKRYFAWETAVAGAGMLILVGALAGWRRVPHRTTVKLLAAGLLIAEALNVGAIMITTYTAPTLLRQVRSLSALVGSQTRLPRIDPAGRPLRKVQAVVIGDSTAAGAGLALAPGPTARACGRSADSYAEDLSSVNRWKVLNLACDSATISHGLLGPQVHNGVRLPPQLAQAERASRASVIIVSVGADDLNWAAVLRYCSVTPNCNDKATQAYFQQQLASFSRDYLDLLSRLAALPNHPQVIINRYYNPFGTQPGCLGPAGLTSANLQTLTSRLATLNAVLAKGASQFRFSSPQPDFTGHELCSTQPYVQGLGAAAPFHPTAAGQLAIALADQAVLQQPGV